MKNIVRIGIATAAVAAALTATTGGAMAAPLELEPMTTGDAHSPAAPIDGAVGTGSSDLLAVPFSLIHTLSGPPCGNPMFC
ncbi:hypothetical protein [Nocardia otitidiscaviarum]|uniref:hypothetical protein n=1 Tax=Nocardia otitidiscaviarum TaxID=1823 RepID=UPI001E59347F|nr:hypothetical protein [Nocardia otitidiscaviarum]